MSLLVLVVEDDDLLRPLTVEAVQLMGFEVTSCSCADEALRLLAKPPTPALVITDVQMPGSMDGLALALTIAGRWPALPVIITSGVPVITTALPPGVKFLPKPASFEALHDLMLAALKAVDIPD